MLSFVDSWSRYLQAIFQRVGETQKDEVWTVVGSWLHEPQILSQRLRDGSEKGYYWKGVVALALISYLALVRLLRYRAVNKLLKIYAPYVKDPYSLDYKTAHKIMLLSMLYDTPFMFVFGTTWALIKTYAVASGTSLLVQTRQLTNDANVGKRAEDTGVLISEFIVGNIDDERGLKALSKVNWLHGRYGAKIKNPDMIHTLAMFVLEPQRWISRYEWRSLTELEKVAQFIYWKEIGNRMGIQDLPQTLKALEDWTEEFEAREMVYSESNRKCAETTTKLYLRNVPGPLKGFARKAADSLLEPHVRLALGTESPPWWIQQFVWFGLVSRAFIIRHLFLPRLWALEPLPKPGPDGRLQRKQFAFEPWYIKDSFWNKISAWLQSNGNIAPGPQWKSEGYLPEELGPVGYEKLSNESVLKQAAEMKKYAENGGGEALGCPFSYDFKYSR